MRAMKDPASTILPMRPIDKAVAPACNSVQLQSPARAIASHFLEAREHTITVLPSHNGSPYTSPWVWRKLAASITRF